MAAMRYMTRISVLVVLLFTLGLAQDSQPFEGSYLWPLKLDKKFSSGFGDLRPGRFHMGVDLRTNSKPGFQVYSPEDGYVYRIKTAYDGYGKALYIKGKSGRIYVFGHLQTYNVPIGTYLRDHQLKDRRYYQDLTLEPGEIKVEKGEPVARTGQTGTGAPHLHFEVRTADNFPTNPLLYPGVKFNDKTPPSFDAFRIQYVDSTSIFPDGRRDKLLIPEKRGNGQYIIYDTVVIRGRAVFQAAISDILGQGSHKLGAREVSFYIDDTLYHSVDYDILDFDQNIFSLLDKDSDPRLAEYKNVYNLFLKTGNKLSNYKSDISGDGSFADNEAGYHNFRVEAVDCFDNKSVLTGSFYFVPIHEILKPFNTIKYEDSTINMPVADGIDPYYFDSLIVYNKPDEAVGIQLYPDVFLDKNGLRLGGNWHGISDITISFFKDGRAISAGHFCPEIITPDGYLVVDSLDCRIEEKGLLVTAVTPLNEINWLMAEIINDNGSKRLFFTKTGPNQFSLFYSPEKSLNRVEKLIIRGPVGYRPDSLDLNIYQVKAGQKEAVILSDSVVVSFDSGDLFDDVLFRVRDTVMDVPESGQYLYGPYIIDPPNMSFADWADFMTRLPEGVDAQKVALYVLDDKKGWQWAGGDYDSTSGWVSSKLGGAGVVAVITDTMPPLIYDLNITSLERIKNSRPDIIFHVKDELSKIENDLNFDVVLDDEIWLVPEYDPESGIFRSRPDGNLSEGHHWLDGTVTDRAGNMTKFEREFMIESPKRH